MAIRKEKIKEVMEPAVTELLQPGEQVQASMLALKGPSPWWTTLFRFSELFWNRNVYVVATDHRVLFLKASTFTGVRPKGLQLSEPRRQGQIVESKRKPIWSVVKFQPSEGKVMRLNVHRIWRNELDGFLQAMSSAPAAPAAGAPTATQPEVPPPPPAP